MSHDVHKTVLRSKIRGVDSFRSLLEMLREKLGEPEDIEDDEDDPDGEVYWFQYTWEARPLQPVTAHGEYGMEMILSQGMRHEDQCFAIDEIVAMSKAFAQMFGVAESAVKLHVVTWYNGSDEPIVW